MAGAVSMALGEYVSVSSQRDTERALLDKERTRAGRDLPEEELDELTAIYVAKGASAATARQLAEELTAKDAFAAHVDADWASTRRRLPTRGTPRSPRRSLSPSVRCCRCWPLC